MMVLALEGVTANVTTIDLRRKPEFFVKSYAGVKLPCLVHNGKAIDDVIEIEAHIERFFPDPPLTIADDRGALKAGDKVFQKFSAWIRNKDPKAEDRLQSLLAEELSRLDAFLGSSKKIQGCYMAGDEMSMPDCALLPRLHQLRVALKAYKDFEIPGHLSNLLQYLRVADANEVFSKTCCDDLEIIQSWNKHMGDPKKAQQVLRAAQRK